MFDLTNFPSTSEVISVYASVAASTMFVRTMANEFVPHQLRGYILSGLRHIFGHLSSTLLTVTIDEYNGLHVNEIFEASEIYLSSKIPPTIQKIRVSKAPRDKNFSIGIEKNQEIIHVFDGIQLKWKFICTEKSVPDCKRNTESRSFELNFNKKHKDVVLASYLPYVLNKSKALKEENEVVKLLSFGHFYGGGGGGGEWRSINLDHPATFDKLAMDPDLKRALIEDLNKFVRRREFYRRVGKAWKRGYLLYGPPGTGKSSLIAAMANYLKFNIYDIELASLHSNAELRGLLVSTSNRSIIVIEDIDCSIDLEDRRFGGRSDKQLTLSGLLNFIDGLWSSCGDERIIVFTTNHLDRLDPALLRPGRMDMHIHMTYCTIPGFKLLASNYLGIHNHRLFKEIEGLILEKVEVTPAEVAEELMKSEDAEVALQGLISFIHRKKKERDEIEALTNTSDPASEEGEERQTTEDQKLNWHRSETNKRKRINRLSTGVKVMKSETYGCEHPVG